MKEPSDGWDDDERDLLESTALGRHVEAVRARHSLGPGDEALLLARIQREARGGGFRMSPGWWIAAAAAAILTVGTTLMTIMRRDASPAAPAISPVTTAVASATPSPVFYLALEKPTIKISPSGLAYRGPGGNNPLLADLKPAFDALRVDDYVGADREFSAIAGKYPASIEIAFYQGVARLFAGNVQGSIDSLKSAERIADSSFSFDVAWYRAIAEERAGNIAEARARLTRLCTQPDARAPSACDAIKRLPAGRLPMP